jgi:hypothetical protein
MYVRFKQGKAYFAHGCIHIRFGKLSAFAQLIEYLVES